ncbi:MAG: hypothetical protein ACT4O1_00990 [Gemmatimonadota bacterium]
MSSKSDKCDKCDECDKCDWRKRYFAPIALIALIASSLAGCGHLLSSYDTAPNGLQRGEHEFRRYLSSGHADSALLQLGNSKKQKQLPKDELLRLLFEGVAAHYSGDYERSASVFDRASLIAEDRSTKSISQAALSVMVNDLALAYEPSRTERLLLPYYAALNYARAGKYDEAAVEARRLSLLLQTMEDEGDAPAPELHAFFRYFAGSMFEAAGEYADADVAYRNASALDSTSPGPPEPHGPHGRPADSGALVIFIEHGFAPHRVQESLFVMLADYETHQFDEDRSEDDRRRASSHIAERVLQFASTAEPRTGAPKQRTLWVPPPAEQKASRQVEQCDSNCEEHEDHSYLLRMSWPVMYAPLPSPPVHIRVDSIELSGYRSAAIGDGLLSDFQREQPVIIARAVARAAAKYVISRSAEKKAGKKNEALGDVIGALANLAGAVTEQADTRSWHLLPGAIGIARVMLSPGTHRVHAGGVDFDTIEIRPGKTTILSRRVWN